MYIGSLSASVYVQHVCTLWLQTSEEGIVVSGPEVPDGYWELNPIFYKSKKGC